MSKKGFKMIDTIIIYIDIFYMYDKRFILKSEVLYIKG